MVNWGSSAFLFEPHVIQAFWLLFRSFHLLYFRWGERVFWRRFNSLSIGLLQLLNSIAQAGPVIAESLIKSPDWAASYFTAYSRQVCGPVTGNKLQARHMVLFQIHWVGFSALAGYAVSPGWPPALPFPGRSPEGGGYGGAWPWTVGPRRRWASVSVFYPVPWEYGFVAAIIGPHFLIGRQ